MITFFFLVGASRVIQLSRLNREVVLKVDMTAMDNGRMVKEHLEQVSGTLESMEEAIGAMSRRGDFAHRDSLAFAW